VKLANPRREQGAQMVAEDRHPDWKIAKLLDISESALTKWKKDKAFAARVAEIAQILSDRSMKYALARRERRIQVLSDAHERILTVIDERGADETMAAAAGWKTGILVRTFKSIGSGDSAYKVEEYAVDVPLLRELRAIQEQIARELGQWTEKREVSGLDGGPIALKMDREELIAKLLGNGAARREDRSSVTGAIPQD
jgi:hypothetical protein